MKLAYVAGSPLPSRIASSVQVAYMCQAFADLGHEVVLFTPDRPEILRDVDDVYGFYGVRPIFRIQRLAWSGGRAGAYRYAATVAFRARRCGADLVYGRYTIGVYAAALVRLPVVYEAHVLPLDAGWLHGVVHRRLLRTPRLKRLVVISAALKQAYQEAFAVPDHLAMVAPDAADDTTDGSEPPTPPRAERLQVGYVGNLYPGKGIELILRLARRCPWADFHVVGGSEADVRAWRDDGAAPSNVMFHGFLPPRDAGPVRRRCDVLVAPYQRRVFGHGGKEVGSWMSPLKVFEYMAAGKPIIASDLPVLREVLVDGETACLCDPEAVDEWADRLAALRDDQRLRERLGGAARREFLTRYTWRQRANRVLSGLLPGPAGRS